HGADILIDRRVAEVGACAEATTSAGDEHSPYLGCCSRARQNLVKFGEQGERQGVEHLRAVERDPKGTVLGFQEQVVVSHRVSSPGKSISGLCCRERLSPRSRQAVAGRR